MKYVNINKEFLVKVVGVLMKGESGHLDVKQFLEIPKRRTMFNSFLSRGRD